MQVFLMVLSVITLFLTGYVLVYYAYLNKHTERDVSFFLSVGIISMVMNLVTNTMGVFVLSWLYLIIAVAFAALGFAVSVPATVGFYTSIGPYFKRKFTSGTLIIWQILSAVCFPVGIVLFFVWYRTEHNAARECGKCALWGMLITLLLLWAILGLVL